MKQNKKGIELNQAMGAVLTIILVALLVIVSIVIFTSLNTATSVANTATTSVNETLAKATPAGITLATGSNARSGVCGAITRIVNTTNSELGLGNITQTGCTVVNSTTGSGVEVGGANWKYSYPYTYTAETAASNSSTTMITQFSNYPALIGLVGTIIFLALVIGVLVASFAFGGRKGV